MPKPILVANWKNHPDSLERASALLTKLGRKKALYKKLHLFIAPPLVYLDTASKKIRSFAKLSSQGFPRESKGTHTSLVTPDILKRFGVGLSIIGHSEERALGETDEIVAHKMKLALKAGIIPLVCVGEKTRDADGEHLTFLRDQIRLSLEGLRRVDAKKIIVAYEPVWAIGKRAKDALTPEDLIQSVIFIRKVLSDLFSREVAEKIPILYGGSVEPKNTAELSLHTGIRGFLIGHASLDAGDFAKIAEIMLEK